MAKFCPDCGVQNPDIGKFCVSCGKAFPQAALMPPIDPIAQPPPPPPSTVPAPESPMEPVTQPAAPAPEQEPSANFTIAGALTAAFLAPGPQSLGDIVIEKLRQIWTNLKKNWKRTLWIKILGSLLFFGLFILATMVFQGMIADTYLISNWARKGGLFKLIGNLWPYLVISQDSKLHVFKGLQFLEGLRKIFTSMPKEIKTSYLVTPLYMIFPAFVMSLLLRIKAGGRRFFRDLAGLPQTIFKYMGLKQRGAQGYGVAMALLLCFLLLNPVTAAVLALWALISVSNRYGSGLMLFFSAGKMDINRINNRAPKHRVESAVGASGGFAVGMVLASAVNLLVWLLFEYRMWSRAVFLLLPAALLFIWSAFASASQQRPMRAARAAAKVLMVCLAATVLAAMVSMPAFADDGGWTESGKNIGSWLANWGTRLMEMFGLEGAAASWAGWLLSTVGGIAETAVGLVSFGGVLLNIFSSEKGKDACNAGIDALGVALPGFGDKLAQMARDIFDGLNGHPGSGSSSGPGSTAGSGGNGPWSTPGGPSPGSGSGTGPGGGNYGSGGNTGSGSGNYGSGSSSGSGSGSGPGDYGSGNDSGSSGGSASGTGAGGSTGGGSGFGDGPGVGGGNTTAAGKPGGWPVSDPRTGRVADILYDLNEEIKKQIAAGNLDGSKYRVLSDDELLKAAQDIVKGYDAGQGPSMAQSLQNTIKY